MRITFVFLLAVFCLNAWAESDEAIVAAAEKLVAEATEAKTDSETKSETKTESEPAKAEVRESEIPVLMSSPKTAKAESNVIWRLMASLVLIAVVGGILMYAARRWSRQKDKGGKQARIDIIHQMHLGPRRSMALVRVSGEVMLIGITDHSINMIKSIALIDDEIENTVKGDFNGFLDDEFTIEDVRTIMNSRT
jgi:flagellar protein FliO/FliZ